MASSRGSEAAHKAWRTRRAKAAADALPGETPVDPGRRAALKAWETRRANAARSEERKNQREENVSELFAWIPWFGKLAQRIAEGGPEFLVPRAKEVPWTADGKQAGLLNYGDDNIDPFSFFYVLASKNDTEAWTRVHDAISQLFSIDPVHVDPDDGFYFPTPPGINALFHNQGDGKPELLWRLMRGALGGLDGIDGADFDEVVSEIKGTGIPKLTQALFLINPDEFVPCDGYSGFAVCGNRNAVTDWESYRRELDVVRSSFPGCEPHEINMVSYVFRMKKPLEIADRAWQIRTNYNETDHWPEMSESNSVWTRDGLPPGCADPAEPRPGDPVFVRYRRQGRGIGVVWKNRSEKAAEHVGLQVLWLNRTSTTPGKELIPGPIVRFSSALSGKGRELVEAWRKRPEYRPTFELLKGLGWKPRPVPIPNGPPDLKRLAEETLIPEGDLRKIRTLLDDKKQVIFQGPPGTGKTYLARKLAACLAGSSDRVRLVQFHPSYAYEDFVQGFRPTLKDGQAGFELRDGPLLRMAELAREADEKHFLIIDEINRGNLSKILGELYFLLEYRDEAIQLQYSDESFSLPKNLYLIGTMNTADRSIALVDLALRRRFHFVEFHPDKAPLGGLLDRWLERNSLGQMSWVARVLDSANAELKDHHAALGPSYFMPQDKKLSEERVRRIWEHNVMPYIEERLFGQEAVRNRFGLDRLRKVAEGQPPPPQGDKAQDGSGTGESDDDAG